MATHSSVTRVRIPYGGEMAVILTGGMNDELDAGTTQILNGPPGSEIGTAGFGHTPTQATATGSGT